VGDTHQEPFINLCQPLSHEQLVHFLLGVSTHRGTLIFLTARYELLCDIFKFGRILPLQELIAYVCFLFNLAHC
jgi:hypothetical protein